MTFPMFATLAANSSIRGWSAHQKMTSCPRCARPCARYSRKISPTPREPELLLARRIFMEERRREKRGKAEMLKLGHQPRMDAEGQGWREESICHFVLSCSILRVEGLKNADPS